MLGNHDFGATLVEFGNDGIVVEGGVSDQAAECRAIDQGRHADGVMALTGQEDEADEVAECIGQRQDFRRDAALGAAYGLALSPPFTPCPWR